MKNLKESGVIKAYSIFHIKKVPGTRTTLSCFSPWHLYKVKISSRLHDQAAKITIVQYNRHQVQPLGR